MGVRGGVSEIDAPTEEDVGLEHILVERVRAGSDAAAGPEPRGIGHVQGRAKEVVLGAHLPQRPDRPARRVLIRRVVYVVRASEEAEAAWRLRRIISLFRRELIGGGFSQKKKPPFLMSPLEPRSFFLG